MTVRTGSACGGSRAAARAIRSSPSSCLPVPSKSCHTVAVRRTPGRPVRVRAQLEEPPFRDALLSRHCVPGFRDQPLA